MSKYDSLKFLKETKARVGHQCDYCNSLIPIGKLYYAETLKDKFLHSINKKKFCSACYQKYKDRLLV